MERLTDEQRALVAKRNKAARSEAHSKSLKEWYYWYVEIDRTFKESQLIYLQSLIHKTHVIKTKNNDLQNTWKNLNL